MSQLGRKHECHTQECDRSIHLYNGVGLNYLSGWHFDTMGEVDRFLVAQGWAPEWISSLFAHYEFRTGEEWARIETQHRGTTITDLEEIVDNALGENS